MTNTATTTTTDALTTLAAIKSSSNALTDRNAKGPHITTGHIDNDTIHVRANGVLIAVILRRKDITTHTMWATRWNIAGPQVAQNWEHLVEDIEDLAVHAGQHDFVGEFPAYPSVLAVLADPAREMSTQDSPWRLTWNGHHLGSAVLETHVERGPQWQVLGPDGVAVTEVEFYTLGMVYERVNALIPFLVA